MYVSVHVVFGTICRREVSVYRSTRSSSSSSGCLLITRWMKYRLVNEGWWKDVGLNYLEDECFLLTRLRRESSKEPPGYTPVWICFFQPSSLHHSLSPTYNPAKLLLGDWLFYFLYRTLLPDQNYMPPDNDIPPDKPCDGWKKVEEFLILYSRVYRLRTPFTTFLVQYFSSTAQWKGRVVVCSTTFFFTWRSNKWSEHTRTYAQTIYPGLDWNMCVCRHGAEKERIPLDAIWALMILRG